MTANEKDFELAFWADCTNTYAEETKQYVMARLMGIRREHFSFRVYGASIIDIGGGPVSMLLKCHDLGQGVVVDPLLNDIPDYVDADRSDAYPKWVTSRYEAKNIATVRKRAEDMTVEMVVKPLDECWIYNCLQHVDDPARITRNALSICRKLRICEPVGEPVYEGHPQALTKEKLDEWLSITPGLWGGGEVTPVSYDCLHGDFYHAVVPGGVK